MALSYLVCWQNEFSSLEANLSLGRGLLVNPILLFYHIVELDVKPYLNQSINPNKCYNNLNPTYVSIQAKTFYL